MKKQTLLKSALILLPALAVGLATTGDSVMVFDTLTGKLEYFSYFDILPYGTYQTITPLAALLCVLVGVLAAICLAAKKEKLLKAVMVISMVTSIVAVAPILMSGDVKIVPNVALPLFMLLEYVAAYCLGKKPDTDNYQEKLKARRQK